MSVRSAVKQIIERGLVISGATGMARRRRNHDVLVLAYHNIVPDGEPAAGDGSLHLSQRAFARQLDMLQQTHEVVPITALIDELDTHVDRPRAVITFDDAYRGAVTAGVAELRRRGLPATVFVAPAYVGGRAFWWDVLTPYGLAALDPSFRHTALTTDEGKDALVLARAAREGRATTQLPTNALCASQDELDAALEHSALTYGSHTWTHPNLMRLTASELASELSAPREWLRRYDDRVVPMISYPYGCADATVWRAAEQAGYTAGFMIDGGWLTLPYETAYTLPRLNIPAGVTADGFALRTAGIVGA